MAPDTPLPPIPERNRSQVAKDMMLFHVKLFTDGIKDLMLAPISLIAGLVSIFLSDKPGDMFYRVLQWGKKMERWIDLFSAARVQAGESVRESDALETDQANEEGTPHTSNANADQQSSKNSVVRDFDSLLQSLQTSLLDSESRARISEQSLEQLNALADRVRGKR